MSRKVLRAGQIQAAIAEAVNGTDAVIEDGETLLIGPPTWRPPEENGCNWTIEYTPRYDRHMALIRASIVEAQRKFNLE